MSIRTIALAAAGGIVASALVVGGISAPAFAADSVVTGYIHLGSSKVLVKSYSTAKVAVGTNIVDPTYGTFFDAVVTAKGKSYPVNTAASLTSTGSGAVDLSRIISRAVFNYGDVTPGTYSVKLTADDEVNYSPDYSSKTTITGASATVTVVVGKLTSKVTGWSTRSKSVRHGGRVSIGHPTIVNAGTKNTVLVQYRKGTRGPWRTVYTGSVPTYSSTALKFKLGGQPFSSVTKSNSLMSRGTWYFRITVKKSTFVTGYTTKPLRVVVR